MKYEVVIRAPDGRHVHRYKTVAGAIKQAEAQLGRPLNAQHAFENDYGVGLYRAPDFPAGLAAGNFYRFVDDYGRVISIAGVK